MKAVHVSLFAGFLLSGSYAQATDSAYQKILEISKRDPKPLRDSLDTFERNLAASLSDTIGMTLLAQKIIHDEGASGREEPVTLRMSFCKAPGAYGLQPQRTLVQCRLEADSVWDACLDAGPSFLNEDLASDNELTAGAEIFSDDRTVRCRIVRK